jgi:F-type H+-transporting ATPase subunit b
MIKIDPWLLLVQIASFLVALFILWRFFWGPLTQMIEKRRAGIRQDIEDARKGKQDVDQIKHRYETELSDIESQAKKMLEAAIQDGQSAKNEVLRVAQAQAAAFLENAKAEIAVEKNLAVAEVRNETVDLAVLIAEKILKQAVDPATRQRMLNEFIDGLKNG